MLLRYIKPFESQPCPACWVSQHCRGKDELQISVKCAISKPCDCSGSIKSNCLTEFHSNLISNCDCSALKGQEVMLRWVLFALFLGICASAGEQKKKKATPQSLSKGGGSSFLQACSAVLSISRIISTH